MDSMTEVTKKKSEEGAWEIIKVIVQALLIAFFIRTFLFQPFNIPSGSMIPTLLVGDYVFVSKLSYGYSSHSFDFSLGPTDHPWFEFPHLNIPGRFFFASTPKRGDVAVFKLPNNPRIDYIKRVIGLPGDRVQVKSGVLYINGEAVKRERIEDYKGTEAAEEDGISAGSGQVITQFRETLPNGVSYITHDLNYPAESSYADNTREFVVPPDHYFMMGDNRDNSMDSRFDVGFVPYENFVGRADIIFFSHRSDVPIWELWKWVRWDRILHLVGSS